MFFLRLQLQHIKDSCFFFCIVKFCSFSLLLLRGCSFFFFFLPKVKTQFFVHDATAALSEPERDVRNHWWCPVFIFRVDLPSVLCFREEAVSHGKTNVRELPKAPPWNDRILASPDCSVVSEHHFFLQDATIRLVNIQLAELWFIALCDCGVDLSEDSIIWLLWLSESQIALWSVPKDLQQYHLIIEAEASSISRVCGGIFVARLPCDRRRARHCCGLRFKLCFLNSYY